VPHFRNLTTSTRSAATSSLFDFLYLRLPPIWPCTHILDYGSRVMTQRDKTPLPTMHHQDEDVERGDMWSTGHSRMDIPWQRHYATGTPLPGSPNRNRSLDDPAESSGDEHNGNKILLTLKERVRHFVWTWFTMTMATGQLANVILAGMRIHDCAGSSETDLLMQYPMSFTVDMRLVVASSSSTSFCSRSTLL